MKNERQCKMPADAKDGMNKDSSLLMIDETRIDFHRDLFLINKNKVQNVEETERKIGTGIGAGRAPAPGRTRNGYKGIDWQWQENMSSFLLLLARAVAKSTQVPNV